MDIRPIKTEQDYNYSIDRIEELWGAKRDTPEGDELDLLITIVESSSLQGSQVFQLFRSPTYLCI